MMRPQVVDEGDGVQIWTAAANILNKKPLTADNGWSSNVVTKYYIGHRILSILERQDGTVWSGVVWLRIGSGGGLL
jgi:hypothetical protein